MQAFGSKADKLEKLTFIKAEVKYAKWIAPTINFVSNTVKAVACD